MASSISGTAAAFITTPFDVVKTRRQVQQVTHSAQCITGMTREHDISLNGGMDRQDSDRTQMGLRGTVL